MTPSSDLHKADLDLVMRQATREKILSAEKYVAYLRVIIILLNSFVYLFMMEKSGTMVSLAYTIILISILYSVPVAIFKPYKKVKIFLAGYFTSITDGTLIALWLIATGGYASPFYVLWFVSIVAVAFRFNSRITLITSTLYATLYLGVALSDGVVVPDSATLLIRISYIFFTGILGSLISGEMFKKSTEMLLMERLKYKAEEAELSLRQSEERIRSILLHAPNIVITTDLDLNITYINKILPGFNIENVLGANVFNFIPEEEEEKMRLIFQKSKKSEVPQSVLIKGPGPNGSLNWYHCNIALIKEKTGKSRILIIATDITERVQIEEELYRSQRKLTLKNKDLSNYAYVISHNLRGQVVNLRSLVDLFEEEEMVTETHPIFLKNFKSTISNLEEILNDVIDIVFTSERKFTEKVNLSFEEICNQTVTYLKRNMQEDVEVHSDFSGVPTYLGEKEVFLQIFYHLISNSFQFRDPGRALRLNITTFRSNGHVCISIKDNGMGMDLEKYGHKIFRMFQKLHYDNPGKGLGLYKTRQLVEALGGRVEVSSKPEEGTEFKIYLPA